MDVHKDSTIAVLPGAAKAPTRLERLPNELQKLKKWMDRVARDGEFQASYESSGAGYVLHRALRDWGYACEVIAPSLIRNARACSANTTSAIRRTARLYRTCNRESDLRFFESTTFRGAAAIRRSLACCMQRWTANQAGAYSSDTVPVFSYTRCFTSLSFACLVG